MWRWNCHRSYEVMSNWKGRNCPTKAPVGWNFANRAKQGVFYSDAHSTQTLKERLQTSKLGKTFFMVVALLSPNMPNHSLIYWQKKTHCSDYGLHTRTQNSWIRTHLLSACFPNPLTPCQKGRFNETIDLGCGMNSKSSNRCEPTPSDSFPPFFIPIMNSSQKKALSIWAGFAPVREPCPFSKNRRWPRRMLIRS